MIEEWEIPTINFLTTRDDDKRSHTHWIEILGHFLGRLRCQQEFLNLWKDADPGIAEVEDARKRVAGLKE